MKKELYSVKSLLLLSMLSLAGTTWACDEANHKAENSEQNANATANANLNTPANREVASNRDPAAIEAAKAAKAEHEREVFERKQEARAMGIVGMSDFGGK